MFQSLKHVLMTYRHWRADGRGSIAMNTALLMVPMLAAAGGAVDYNRAERMRENLQHAADAAALAGATRLNLSDAELNSFVGQYLDRNMRAITGRSDVGVINYTVTRTADGLRVTANADVKTMIAQVVGIQKINVGVVSRVNSQIGSSPLEVVFVSDVTGSMIGTRINALRNGMNMMIQEMGGRAKPGSLKFGIVPYTTVVNIGSNNTQYLDSSADSTYHGVNFENHVFKTSPDCGWYQRYHSWYTYHDKWYCTYEVNHTHSTTTTTTSSYGNSTTDSTTTSYSNSTTDSTTTSYSNSTTNSTTTTTTTTTSRGNEDARFRLPHDSRLAQGEGVGLKAFFKAIYASPKANAHVWTDSCYNWDGPCGPSNANCSVVEYQVPQLHETIYDEYNQDVDPDTAEYCYDERVNPPKINHMDLYNNLPNVSWKGCVEARPHNHGAGDLTGSGLDETDDPITGDPNTKWVPYFWPDEPDGATTYFRNDYMDDNLPQGYNMRPDWTQTFTYYGVPPLYVSGLPDGRWNYVVGNYPNRLAYLYKYNASANRLQETPSSPLFATYSPNKACPAPVLPLTDNFQAAINHTNSLVPFNGGGTMSPVGLVWGWRLLSPTEPFTQGAAYGQAHKAVILMTDGANNWQTIGTGGYTSPVLTHYTPYGYLRPLGEASRSRFPHVVNYSESAFNTWARNMLDAKLKRICDRMKANNIEIFVILFDPDNNIDSTPYQYCASQGNDYVWRPGMTHFFEVFTSQQLVDAYRSIAESFFSMRLTE